MKYPVHDSPPRKDKLSRLTALRSMSHLATKRFLRCLWDNSRRAYVPTTLWRKPKPLSIYMARHSALVRTMDFRSARSSRTGAECRPSAWQERVVGGGAALWTIRGQ